MKGACQAYLPLSNPNLSIPTYFSYYTEESRISLDFEDIKQTTTMPLVVPGINNTSGGASQEEWLNKLAGKKLTESSSDVTVWLYSFSPS